MNPLNDLPSPPSSPGSPISPVGTPILINEKYPLSLKVMRLKKPEFAVSFPVLLESGDSLGSTKESYKTNYPVNDDKFYDPRHTKEAVDSNLIMDGLGLVDKWELPNIFGKIYVGETFSCFLSLHNLTFASTKGISVKGELLTGNNANNKTVLLDVTDIKEMASQSNADFIIEHPLSQPGDHTLIITISYLSPLDNTIQSFYKVFKFPVDNPLAMNAVKIFNLNEHVFVHLELQNKMDKPLFVDVVRLDPSIGYELTDHSTHNSGPPQEQLMQVGEIRRFLYELAALKNNNDPVTNITTTVLGMIELQWKGNMGDNGILVTHPIQHRMAPRQDVEAHMDGTLDDTSVFVERPFTLMCTLTNRSARQCNLVITYNNQKMYPLCADGSSTQHIGLIEPNTSVRVEMHLFAMKEGLHVFGPGVIIKDTTHNKLYPLGNLSQIQVVRDKGSKGIIPILNDVLF
ncbi:trafficking protein particle complex subunit [Acrasis kona]|uniref:Trafficking protein particle complex subunit n=1 Tax=Acrasis kona TaxID=1008807 RepID=A0AAW2Z5A2_9EUKA